MVRLSLAAGRNGSVVDIYWTNHRNMFYVIQQAIFKYSKKNVEVEETPSSARSSTEQSCTEEWFKAAKTDSSDFNTCTTITSLAGSDS
jgi:hypothetical protein